MKSSLLVCSPPITMLKIQTWIMVISCNIILQSLGFPRLGFIRSVIPQDYGIQIKFDSNVFLSYRWHSSKSFLWNNEKLAQGSFTTDSQHLTINKTDAMKQSVCSWGNRLQLETVKHKKMINVKMYSYLEGKKSTAILRVKRLPFIELLY